QSTGTEIRYFLAINDHCIPATACTINLKSAREGFGLYIRRGLKQVREGRTLGKAVDQFRGIGVAGAFAGTALGFVNLRLDLKVARHRHNRPIAIERLLKRLNE